MPSVQANKMRAVLFVEVNGEPYRCTLPQDRMELLLPLAAALFDNQKLGLAPTTLFKFPPAADGVKVTPMVPCPICGGEAVHAQDVLARTIIAPAPGVSLPDGGKTE